MLRADPRSRTHARGGYPLPSVYDLKPAFQRLLRPLVRALVSSGVTPNHLTLAGVAGSAFVGITVAVAAPQPRVLLLLPAWLLARMALNAMDGMAAREHQLASRAGGALNEIGDVISDLALYLPLAAFDPARPWPAVAFAMGAVLTEFCGVLGPALGAARRYDGPMGKSDRALVAGVLGLLGACVPSTIAWWPTVFWIASALALVTSWNRVTGALRAPARVGP
jgi:CDP-diacylglycerol--glycerol-3-phosphate 3-phosphatidyltransferase